MRCPSCGFENPEALRFCGWCGTKVGNRCPRCSAENPTESKFCGECGSSLAIRASPPRQAAPARYTPPHLAERILAEQASLETRAPADGERKTITALFADIRGSMELMEDLDPEAAQKIVDPALDLMMRAVHRYEGYVAQSTGDGIFALFGAPIAHEDHPQRALYAALRMQEDVRTYGAELRLEKGIHLEIRVGVNTGEVVLRSIRKDDLRTDYVPIGHSTGLAARMESLAAPSTIVVSDHTWKLTDGYFEFRSLGPTKIKGVSEPLAVHQLLGPGRLRTKLEVAARRGLTKFVGRRGEMEHLRRAWQLARDGRGQIIGVVGEPGVGKSRLFHEFKHATQGDGLLLEAFSVSHGKAYPYLPLIELLNRYFHFDAADDDARRRAKVHEAIGALDRSLEDTEPYLLSVLGFGDPGSPLAQMDGQIRRQRTFDAIKRIFLRETLRQPLQIIIEDVHWLDAETQTFLEVMGDALPSARMLLLLNHRPEYEHPWGGRGHFTQLRLDPLEIGEARELLDELLGVAPELDRLKKLIIDKTEGNPFFVQEIVQTLFDEGVLLRGQRVSLARPLTAVHLPPTVQGVLASRMDRLPIEEKSLLQTLAVLGREFSASLAREIVEIEEDSLQGLLARLRRREFLFERPAFPEVQYVFKHALTQEVAYGSILAERRKNLHERAARSVERLFAGRLEEHYGELAHHYGQSGNVEKAVEYSELAGERAVRLSANPEAVEHFNRALRLLATQPEGAVRNERELKLQMALGAPLMAANGYAAPEVEAVYERARELCIRVGESSDLVPILWGLWVFDEVRGNQRSALERGRHLLHIADSLLDPALLVVGHNAIGESLFWTGDFLGGREHLEQGTRLDDSLAQRAQTFMPGQDPRVTCTAFSAWAASALGYFNVAATQSSQAITLARELGHPFSLSLALVVSAGAAQFRRDVELVETNSNAIVALSEEHGFPYWRTWGIVLGSWASALRTSESSAAVQLDHAVTAMRASGEQLAASYMLCMLAESYARIGQSERALQTLNRALEAAETNGEYFYDAEIHRLKGEIAIAASGSDDARDAEGSFRRAIDIARSQNAKTFELRATASLARLLRRQGKAHEAREMLAAIYAWFTEGLESADLREAKALLDALARERAGSNASATAAIANNILRREGEYWTIGHNGEVFRLKNLSGLWYLAHLLGHPGAEFHAIDLLLVVPGASDGGTNGDATLAGRGGDAGDVLDAQARAEYKKRLLQLRDELEQGRALNDRGRAERAREEMEFLTEELARGFGLGGRARKAASQAERARINVTRSITKVLAKIRQENPALGRQLQSTVRTGTFCCYEPDPRNSVPWTIAM